MIVNGEWGKIHSAQSKNIKGEHAYPNITNRDIPTPVQLTTFMQVSESQYQNTVGRS